MKTKCLKSINAVIAFLLCLLGFSGCELPSVEYGVPHADLDIEGQVSNEENEVLPDIQIVAWKGWKDGGGTLYWQEYADTLYTDSTGRFYRFYENTFPLEYHRIIANDTTGTYASDTIDATVSYSGGNGGWYEGKATLNVTFILQKNSSQEVE
ncbi:MAG: radical SAM-associated putative lipoprotein [Paludibacteraceae bacterium]|nr:radical SAM-associated putative lipoprotein [Paludibacteraceae bacterium]